MVQKSGWAPPLWALLARIRLNLYVTLELYVQWTNGEKTRLLCHHLLNTIVQEKWSKVERLASVEDKTWKRGCFRITSCSSWPGITNLVTINKSRWFILLYVNCARTSFSHQVRVLQVVTCNTQVYQSFYLLLGNRKGRQFWWNNPRFSVMLNLRVAIRNTLRYKLKISGKSINSAQSLFHSGLIQTLEMAMKV